MLLKTTLEAIPTILSRGASAPIGDGHAFRYKANINAMETFQGMVIQDFLCSYFQYTKFIVFSSYNLYGEKTNLESSDGTYCILNKMAAYFIFQDSRDIDTMIEDAKSVGARIFFFAITDDYIEAASVLLERGYKAGLFGENRQIFSVSDLNNPKLWLSMTAEADVPAIMKGFMILKPASVLQVLKSKKGPAFLQRWRQQQSTVSNIDGRLSCDAVRDDDGLTFLYRSEGSGLHRRYTCSGLNFSEFSVSGDHLADFVGHTYDAVGVLARGLDLTLNSVDSHFDRIDSSLIIQNIIDNVQFEGVTGTIDIFEG